MGHVNIYGIYQYDEDDDQATFSDLLNLQGDALTAGKAFFRGPAVERAALEPAPPGTFWKDTDGLKRLWSAAPDGTWRRHSGRGSSPADAWAVTAGGVSGRTFNAVLPTILSADEDIQLRYLGGSGFVGNVTIVSLTRGPASTTVNIAYLQYFNATQTACEFGWEVVAGA